MMSSVESNRCVLVTGCSSGIGRLTVLKLLREGWHVIATMRDSEQRGSGLISEAQEYSSKLDVLNLDVTSHKDQLCLMEFIVSNQKQIYCLINNAGYGLFGALEDLSEKQIRDQLEVNFFSVVSLIRVLLPHLRRSSGRIINISSVLGYVGMPLTSLYCSSKFAIEGLSESLYHELSPFGVQVAIVEPGGHRTSFGKNVKWAENANSNESPYVSYTRNYKEFSSKLASGKGVPPSRIADTIAALLKRKNMPLRTRCGNDAFGLYLLKKLLPQKSENFILQKFYKRAFMR